MWTLLLSRLSDPPGTFIDRRQIDSGEIRIGRDAVRADWVLPDTTGYISRTHCTISVIGLDLFVVDTSTNGVSLNRPEQRIAPQQPVAVRVNDRLLLGDYAIEVATQASGLAANLQAQVDIAAQPPAARFGQPDNWFDPVADPIWGDGGRGAEVHEFLGNAMHDFLAPPAPQRAGAGDPWGGPLSDAFSRPLLAAAPPPAPADFAIPEDWAAPAKPAARDPFAAPPGGDPFARSALAPGRQPDRDPFAPPPASPAQATGGDPFALPPAPLAPAPGGDPFALPSAPPAQAPGGDPFALPPVTPAPVRVDDPFDLPPVTDPFADFASAPHDDPFAAFAPPADVAPRAKPEAEASPAGDPFAPPPPPIATPRPAPTASATAADGGTVGPDAGDWAAFCEGAGLDPDSVRSSPDAMRRFGVLYKQVVLGLSDLVQDRAAFKDEFRVERTQLGLGRNNPLKHLPAIQSARLLLDDPLPGFMGAEEAVRTAFEDVKKHQMAMLAGVQHALRAVFERLAPEEITRVMEKAAADKRGLRFGRGVNPWTVYQAVFDALRKDATSNVNSIMSVAFRDGYEAFLKGRAA